MLLPCELLFLVPTSMREWSSLRCPLGSSEQPAQAEWPCRDVVHRHCTPPLSFHFPANHFFFFTLIFF